MLLLGGDAGAGRWGLRPDSMTVASIDADTGRTVLIGAAAQHDELPLRRGLGDGRAVPRRASTARCYLNGVSTWAGDHTELFGKSDTPGVDATVMAIEGITGLKINYWAMVNLEGFKDLVDAVGGVTLNVRAPIPVGGLGSDVTGYIEPGVRKLNGHDTLWFARARDGSDDYSRMARQKCVMSAMLQQISPQVALRNFERIAEASSEMISTNIPASEVDRFIELALKARDQKVSTLSLVPPMINTGDPDIDLVQEKVAAAIDRAEGRRPRRAEQKKKPHRPSPAARSAASARGTPPTRPTTSGVPADAESARLPAFDGRRVGAPAARGRCVSADSGAPSRARSADSVRRRVFAVTDQPTHDAPRVVAVVVTFNRLALLQRLVSGSQEVPELAEIVVVDNASTDGTGEWLAASAAAADDPAVVARTLDRNRGGAGGFHEGLRLAVERGADLVWLMDDDGLPDPDCLSTLLAHARRPRLLGPGRGRRGRPGPAGVPDPAARRRAVVHRMADVEQAARDGVIRGRRDPVQRRPGHPRAGASGSACPARSSSSGATTTSTACGPSRPAPGSPPSSTPGCGTRRSATWARR